MSKVIGESQKYMMDTYGRLPLVIAKGEGCYLYDEEGNEYIDFCAGIATNVLGYQHPALCEALKEQMDKLMHISNLYYTTPQVEAAKLLVENSDFNKVFFCNSGTEANEAAIKLARKWGKQQEPQKHKVITMANSFHGRTYGALSATGQEKYQKHFTPMVPGFEYVLFNDIEALKKSITPDVCAIMLEVIQGEGGVQLAIREYLEVVSKVCEEHHILLIIDEVQTGIGRCGTLFGYTQFGVVPDIVTLAKGLGGGIPIGAMLCNEKANVFEKGDHAATFGGNPLSTTAAKVVLEILLKGDMLSQIKDTGDYLHAQLELLKSKYPLIKEVRGKGLMQAIELRNSARPIMEQCMDKGLILVGAGEKVIRFLPPLIVTPSQIDQGVERLEAVLKENV